MSLTWPKKRLYTKCCVCNESVVDFRYDHPAYCKRCSDVAVDAMSGVTITRDPTGAVAALLRAFDAMLSTLGGVSRARLSGKPFDLEMEGLYDTTMARVISTRARFVIEDEAGE